MKTWVKGAAGLTLGLAFFGGWSITGMIIDREPPITYEGARAMAASVPQGKSVDIEFKVFRTRICPVVAKRWLIDAAGERHSIPSYTVGMKFLAGRETYQRSITVPDAAAIGPAWYEVDLDYVCNVIHRFGFPIHVISPPIGFNIVPADG